MKLTGLLSRNGEAPPGITGAARVTKRTRELVRRAGPGDIVLLDQVDLDRATADALVHAKVAAVVNASRSISGRYPNLGPEILLSHGITLVDGVGTEVLHALKDGSKIRLHDGVLYRGEDVLASGTEQSPTSVADSMIQAKQGMSAQLEAFSANTMEFLHRERTLLLDGVGVPELGVAMRDRHVLVVAPGTEHAKELARLKSYISEHRPVLIGVDLGADTLRAAGYTPQVIVGDPTGIDTDSLSSGAEVVVPAQPNGYAPGVERIQDLGIGAVTFPSAGNPEDLALLLADAHGAELVVTVGFQATLREFLDQGRSGSNPSTFLTRLKLGSKLVDGRAIAALRRSKISITVVLLLFVAALIAVLAALLVTGTGSAYFDWALGQGESAVEWVGGLFG